jgi:probable rRNA maturation factor
VRSKTPQPRGTKVSLLTPSPSLLSLSVQYACNGDELPSRAQVRRWAKAAMKTEAQVTVRFVDADEGQTLNRKFRHKDYATNVLSFCYEQSPVIGDLVLCAPVVQREADEQHKAPMAHFAHMIVHGMLHLQGYDHGASKLDAQRMESKEREILARFGIADPY